MKKVLFVACILTFFGCATNKAKVPKMSHDWYSTASNENIDQVAKDIENVDKYIATLRSLKVKVDSFLEGK